MKLKFIFDRILNRENICNLKEEQRRIKELIENKQNIVLYAPRNFGKTSLIKTIIIPDFKKENKKSFVFFVDLMGIRDLRGLRARMHRSLEIALQESFPVKNLIQNAKNFLKSIRPEASVIFEEGSIKFHMKSTSQNQYLEIEEVFRVFNNIAKEYPSLVVMDEFQDIAFVGEAEALFRNAFQNLHNCPIITLGSKQHILAEIFAKPNAALANFPQRLV